MMLDYIGYGIQSIIGLGNHFTPSKIQPLSYTLPQDVDRFTPSSEEQMQKYLQELQDVSMTWVETKPQERAELFMSCIPHILDTSEAALDQLVKIKGMYEAGKGEERVCWLLMVQTMMSVAEQLKAEGQLKPNKIFQNSKGQKIVDVYPQGPNRILNNGVRSKLYIQKGKPTSQGKLYKEKSCGQVSTGGISLVLGAGNEWFLAVVDMLHKLVFDDQVVILKMNPVLDSVGPYIVQALKPIHDKGFFKIVYGGAEQGKFLSNHQMISSIHLTGSSRTYDAMVWGDDKEKKGSPLIKVPFTAELGNVTPFIIVPGDWSESDIRYHVRNSLIPGKIRNCSHDCLAMELLVTYKNWNLREKFINIFKEEMNQVLQRKHWYPGSMEKYNEFQSRFPNCDKLGKKLNETDDVIPVLGAFNLSPEEAWLDQEKFSLVFQEVVLDDCKDPGEFMTKAAQFVNQKCFGSLVCSVFVHPSTQKQFAQQYEDMCDMLQYGSIVINGLPGIAYGIEAGVWGAYPGNDPRNIGSGTGFVRNQMMFEFVEKQLVEIDFRLPYTINSAQNSNVDDWSKAIVDMMSKPTLFSFFNVFYQLFRMRL